MQLEQAIKHDADTELLTFSAEKGFEVVPRRGRYGALADALLKRQPRAVGDDSIAYEDADGRCLLVVGCGWSPPIEILLETPCDIPAVDAAVDDLIEHRREP